LRRYRRVNPGQTPASCLSPQIFLPHAGRAVAVPELNRKATPVSLLETEISARLTTLQMAEDALAYRQQRLSRPCPDCVPGRRCPDHVHDEGLAGRYQHVCDQALSYALEGTTRPTSAG
jgi:hypothetical protein